MRRTRWVFPLLLPVLWLITGCGAAAPYGDRSMAMMPPEEPGYAEAPSPSMTRKADANQADLASEQPASTETFVRKIVYRGWFTVDVYDIEKERQALVDFVVELGGYLEQQQGSMVVVRVPAKDFDTVLPRLRKLGRVDDALTNIQAQDVTEEYQDLELRLRTKHEYLESLRKLLDQSGKLEEKLAVQKEIARVVEEIERMEGRLRLLKQMVSYATVTVTFRPAQTGPSRRFKLPWHWLDSLGIESLLRP